jgi:SAM-dependent methyltransferase
VEPPLSDTQPIYVLSHNRSQSPLDWFVECHYLYEKSNLFHGHYEEWRFRRVRKVLSLLEGGLEGKTLLELGGGTGDIGAFFASLGAKVTSLEGRSSNVIFANAKHRNVPNFKSVLFNLEEDFSQFGRFDYLINFGFIEVIKNIQNVLHWSRTLSDKVFVETMVLDTLDPNLVGQWDMDPNHSDHALTGWGSRPSPFYIERVFVESGFKMKRCFDSDLNVQRGASHRYDWEHKDDKKASNENRRFWYFYK